MFMGIDPALNLTGYAILNRAGNGTVSLVESGVIKNKTGVDFAKKLVNLFDSIATICDLYKPSVCGIEETFVNVNATSSLKLGAARGAIISAVAKRDIPIYEYSPNNVKKTTTGFGKADKTQVEFMVRKIVGNIRVATTLDETDAIAIALTCLLSNSSL